MDHDLLVASYALDFPSDSNSTPPIAVAFYDLSARGLVTALGHVLLPEPEHLDGLPLVDLDGGMAYVVAAHGDESPGDSYRFQLHVIDASDPTAPRPRGMLDLPARPRGVQARRGHVVLELDCKQVGGTGPVVAEDRADCGVVAVDATDPDAPRFAGRLHPTAGDVWEGNRVALSEDGWAYLAVGAWGILSYRLWHEDGVLPETPTPEPTPNARPSPVASPPPPTPGGEKHCARVWLPVLHAAP
jgi:hypothetical protein